MNDKRIMTDKQHRYLEKVAEKDSSFIECPCCAGYHFEDKEGTFYSRSSDKRVINPLIKRGWLIRCGSRLIISPEGRTALKEAQNGGRTGTAGDGEKR